VNHNQDAVHQDPPDTAGHLSHRWSTVAVTILTALALLLACAAAFVKFQAVSVRETYTAQAESVRAATDGTIALLSYKPETVQKDLEAAQSRLSGSFLRDYTQLIHGVVIPGAQQKRISAVATVPAAAAVRATQSHAEVLLYVDQTITMGDDAPTNTASTVRVTLDKLDNHWLISQFDPV
jgi:Mce-associated membrane protein